MEPTTDKENTELLRKAVWLSETYNDAYEVLFFLMDQIRSTNVLLCTYKLLSEFLNISVWKVAQALAYLANHKFISIHKTTGRKVFIINPKLLWPHPDNKKWVELE